VLEITERAFCSVDSSTRLGQTVIKSAKKMPCLNFLNGEGSGRSGNVRFSESSVVKNTPKLLGGGKFIHPVFTAFGGK